LSKLSPVVLASGRGSTMPAPAKRIGLSLRSHPNGAKAALRARRADPRPVHGSALGQVPDAARGKRLLGIADRLGLSMHTRICLRRAQKKLNAKTCCRPPSPRRHGCSEPQFPRSDDLDYTSRGVAMPKGGDVSDWLEKRAAAPRRSYVSFSMKHLRHVGVDACGPLLVAGSGDA
jgi:hypothetical protein